MKRRSIQPTRIHSTSFVQTSQSIRARSMAAFALHRLTGALLVSGAFFGISTPVLAAAPASSVSPLSSGLTEDMTAQAAQVDLIELNHFVDKEGREVFQQTVFYDWSKTHRQFHVRAWRLVRHSRQLPKRKWNPNRYVCVWLGKQGRRQVSAPQMRETWTQQDPERVNRPLLSEDMRQPLFEEDSQ